jgi:acetyl esterase/lipase
MTYDFDPELVPLLELLPPLGIENVVQAREGFLEMTRAFNADIDESGVRTEDRSIPGPAGAPEVAVRLYTPEGTSQPVPGLLYLHGGGFVIGNLDSEHANCVALCRNLGVVIVSVDYRLAPETPYPGGLEDCYAALLWAAAQADSLHIDPSRLGIMGQSAGGGLSAATALLARDRQGPALCFQYLGIPEVDDRLDTPSMRAFTDTPMWNRPNAVLSWDYYLGADYRRGADDVPGYAAPARMEDLSGLPPAYITTMEFDPLRDEGILYALRLLQAGVSVELHSYPGTFHGSSVAAGAEVSLRESAEMFRALRRGLDVDL